MSIRSPTSLHPCFVCQTNHQASNRLICLDVKHVRAERPERWACMNPHAGNMQTLQREVRGHQKPSADPYIWYCTE